MPYTHTGPGRLWLTEKGDVVEDGDVRAAFLLIADGQTMSDEAAAAYGLVASEAEASEPGKAAQPKPNKARVPRENTAG